MGMLSKPIEKLIARLAHHAGTGQLLAGWKIQAAPAPAIDGTRDLPCVQIKVPTPSESYRQAFVVPSMTVGLVVSTRRAASPNAITEHCAAVEKLLDALDLDDAGKVDPGLCGTLRAPMTFRAGQQNVLDVSVNTELTLTLEPRAAVRGSRTQ